MAAPWLDEIQGDIGKYRDGPDVPMLAAQVARAFPEDKELAAYAALAGPSTAWCGIYVAAKLAKYGIRPPLDGQGVKSFMDRVASRPSAQAAAKAEGLA